MQVTNTEFNKYLTAAHATLDSPAFRLNALEDAPWKSEFIQLITSVHGLLKLANQAGKRVDFLEGVGVTGKIQDITSLITWMYDRLPELATDKPGQLTTNRLNRYANQGWGYFANGSFFTAEFNNELAFFIDDQRVYLNRQIRRAVSEVEYAHEQRL
ncbi:MULTISPECIES: hypothetical protein [Spirosoma]|uniref:DinB family protein n=1 Tax=Spirosoma liriopis TaxID=2937440 RepID=A0ABT0HUJ3_9BACT|nr:MULTISPECIES: hypothetical protein [Spirosoma]MCK8495625.1 hypothetical protein [Spirosoma liriopis]UHG94504.1 hypothetical protein LQ777_28360 [Spirosoma oryzicola]